MKHILLHEEVSLSRITILKKLGYSIQFEIVVDDYLYDVISVNEVVGIATIGYLKGVLNKKSIILFSELKKFEKETTDEIAESYISDRY